MACSVALAELASDSSRLADIAVRPTDRQRERVRYRQTGKQGDGETDRETKGEKDSQSVRQREGKTDTGQYP